MKNITLILFVICVSTMLFATVACNGDISTDTIGGREETITPDSNYITEPPSVEDTPDITVEDTEDDVYIRISPSDDEQKWGDLNRAGN